MRAGCMGVKKSDLIKNRIIIGGVKSLQQIYLLYIHSYDNLMGSFRCRTYPINTILSLQYRHRILQYERHFYKCSNSREVSWAQED